MNHDTSSSGVVATKSRKPSHTSDIGVSPVGSPVLEMATRANRSGCSATRRSPISPPQSCATSVTSRRSSRSNSSRRVHSTCRA
jgi:hypothetical protein